MSTDTEDTGQDFRFAGKEAASEVVESPRQNGPCLNTDRELWREHPGDYYADSIHVTEGGGIGINCGGLVYVKPLRAWHELAQRSAPVSGEGAQVLEEKEAAGRNTHVLQNELLGVVKAAYLKHHIGLDNIGWDALSDMMQNALCNTMGDVGFQRWLEENTR